MPEETLIVTPTPPGSWGVGPIILRDVIRQYPKGTFSLFQLGANPFDPCGHPDLAALPSTHGTPPTIYRAHTSSRISALGSLLQTLRALPGARALAMSVSAYAAERGASKIWLILSRPPALLVGGYLVSRCRLPVYSLVWDDPRYVMQQAGMDSISRRVGMRFFDTCVARSRRTAVVSDAMAQRYGRDHGATCVIARHATAHRGSVKPRRALPESGPIRIGFAGGQYAPRAWDALTGALDQLRWRMGDRSVTLRVLGSEVRLSTRTSASVEMLGWRTTEEVAQLLAECDLLYLPYPFGEALRDCAELSFPTKLSTYVATGIPVFVHSPDYSPLIPFFRKYPAGVVCTSLKKDDVCTALTDILLDGSAYARACDAVVEIVDRELSVESFRQQYSSFLDLPA